MVPVCLTGLAVDGLQHCMAMQVVEKPCSLTRETSATHVPHMCTGSRGEACPALIRTLPFGEGNAFPLPFLNQGPLKLRKRTHDREQEPGHRRIVTRKGQVLFDKLDLDALAGQGMHDPAQIIQIPRQPVHAVHHDRVAVACVAHEQIELGPLGVFARGLIYKGTVQRDAFQLPLYMLMIVLTRI
jgi:hypothetical protein